MTRMREGMLDLIHVYLPLTQGDISAEVEALAQQGFRYGTTQVISVAPWSGRRFDKEAKQWKEREAGSFLSHKPPPPGCWGLGGWGLGRAYWEP